jgi:beta-glucosidase
MAIFSEDFLWGASTSGHQVEGGNYDQWTVWELAHAKELAKTAKKRYSWQNNWEEIKQQAENPDNYVSGKGADHWNKYKEDFNIIESLGLNAFRFGMEWSRFEPEEGVWDKTAIDHYHNYVAELKSRGIEPVVNLWHWTCPVWFEEKGGFFKTANISYFLKFVSKFAEEFKDEIKFVITLNEPNVYCTYADINKVPVPPKGTLLQRLIMYRRLVKVHKYSYRILKKANPNFEIGIAQQIGNDQPKNKNSMLQKLIAKAATYIWGLWFMDRIKRQMDFVGFNYYFTSYYTLKGLKNPTTPVNDMGWYMEPAGITEVATKLWARYKKPVMITENGLADANDQYRQWWIKETMLALVKIQKSGVKLIGYMHWSLLDNFEWHNGWWPKFGLVSIDRENGMKRTVRPSARWWAAQLKLLKKDT